MAFSQTTSEPKGKSKNTLYVSKAQDIHTYSSLTVHLLPTTFFLFFHAYLDTMAVCINTSGLGQSRQDTSRCDVLWDSRKQTAIAKTPLPHRDVLRGGGGGTSRFILLERHFYCCHHRSLSSQDNDELCPSGILKTGSSASPQMGQSVDRLLNKRLLPLHTLGQRQ